MRMRTRVLGGSLALIALTLGLVQGVWASTCSPVMAAGHDGMDTAGYMEAPTADPHAGMTMAAGMSTAHGHDLAALASMHEPKSGEPAAEPPAPHDCDHPHSTHGQPGNGASCPFSAAGSAEACAAAASLPARGVVAFSVLPHSVEDTLQLETEPHLLLGFVAFHPPRR